MTTRDIGIPIPPARTNNKKWPIADLQPGDSCFLPFKNSSRISSLIYDFRQKGWRFTTRRVKENNVEGTRVWRINDDGSQTGLPQLDSKVVE